MIPLGEWTAQARKISRHIEVVVPASDPPAVLLVCPTCGALVLDQPEPLGVHHTWHRRDEAIEEAVVRLVGLTGGMP